MNGELSKLISELKENPKDKDTDTDIIPEFLKEEFVEEEEEDEGNPPSAETTGPLASKEMFSKDTDSDNPHPTAESSGTVAFKGAIRDEYNYNYYMNSANSHKDSAQRYERDAKDRYDWASRNSDDPSKARIYIKEGENYSSKAQSEWSAYRDDLDKANSYR